MQLDLMAWADLPDPLQAGRGRRLLQFVPSSGAAATQPRALGSLST